jgi:chorismate--pyruvate lyase
MTTIHYERDSAWRSREHLSQTHFPDALRAWLLDTHSLTACLQRACPGRFRVQPLDQGWRRPLRSESQALGANPARLAWVRQVTLYCNDVPWVYARTVIPKTTLSGKERRLAFLQNRSLGQILFSDPTMRRLNFEIAQIAKGEKLHHLACANVKNKTSTLWGRRSVFLLSDKPLLVSEFFLPGLPAFVP